MEGIEDMAYVSRIEDTGAEDRPAPRITTVVVGEDDAYRMTMPDSIGSYHAVCGCDLFDVARRYIGTRLYDIYCDDVGLVKGRPVTAVDAFTGEAALFGTLVVSASDGEGAGRSLTAEEVEEVGRCVLSATLADGREVPMLVCATEPFDPEEAVQRLAGGRL